MYDSLGVSQKAAILILLLVFVSCQGASAFSASQLLLLKVLSEHENSDK